MSALPTGWAHATLGELALSVKNGIFVSRPGSEPVGVPILRISAVRALSLNLADVRYASLDKDQLSAADVLLEPGDLLFTRYNGNPEYVGACASVPAGTPPTTFPDKLIRVRVDGEFIDPRFVELAFAWERIRSQVRRSMRTTAGQVGISGRSLKAVRLPVPPLAEQHRIVATLEEILIGVDAAASAVDEGKRKLDKLRRATLARLRETAIAEAPALMPIGMIAETRLGKMLDSKRNNGVATPYLRNINVRWHEFDLRDVLTVPMQEAQRTELKLEAGDLLVCEGGEPGRCAVWSGNGGLMTFQKALHRIRPRSGVAPEWVALMLEESSQNNRLLPLLTGTTIKHLPQEKLREVRIPVPTVATQDSLLRGAREVTDGVARLGRAVALAEARGADLRHALLQQAFTGRLLSPNLVEKPASVSLERSRVQQEQKLALTRRRRPVAEQAELELDL